MSVFSEIKIENFRGISSLMLSDLRKINVIVGKNNSGKSSVLEAVFMLLGMSNPYSPVNVNKFRNMGLWNTEHLKFLFKNADIKKSPTVVGCLRNNTERSLYIEPNFSITHDNDSLVSTDTKSTVFGLKIGFNIKNVQNESAHYSCSLPVNTAGIVQSPIFDASYVEQLSAVYLLPNNKSGNTIQNLSQVIKKQNRNIVVDLLKEFDKRISGIDILNDGIYISVDGISELLPLYMAGDGLRSFLDIILSVISENYDIVLIDEIDNGLHYTAHRQLWKALLLSVEKTGCQIFVTTHNLECLKSLNHTLNEPMCRKDDVAIYTISQTKSGIRAYRNDGFGLQTIIDQSIEIRE